MRAGASSDNVSTKDWSATYSPYITAPAVPGTSGCAKPAQRSPWHTELIRRSRSSWNGGCCDEHARCGARLCGDGFPVFPCLPRAKEPAVKRGFHAATTNPETIRRFWRVADRNVGIRTGMASRVWIIDVDGEDGEASLRASKPSTEHCRQRGNCSRRAAVTSGFAAIARYRAAPARSRRDSMPAVTAATSSRRRPFTPAAAPMHGRSIAQTIWPPPPTGCCISRARNRRQRYRSGQSRTCRRAAVHLPAPMARPLSTMNAPRSPARLRADAIMRSIARLLAVSTRRRRRARS